MVTYYFITSELTGSLRTILVLSGYNLSCLRKGFEGETKLQLCLAKRHQQTRMLVLLVTVTGYLFELAEGFDQTCVSTFFFFLYIIKSNIEVSFINTKSNPILIRYGSSFSSRALS